MNAGTVRVRTIVPPARATDADAALLWPGERRRADRIRTEAGRTLFVTARAELRRLLGEELGHPPVAVCLEAAPGGRPVLVDDPGLRFSVAHTDGMVVIALTRDCGIGVDVERRDRWPLPQEGRWLALAETERLTPLTDPERHLALLRTWTAKEAVAKGIGAGIVESPTAIEIDGDGATSSVEGSSAAWRLLDLDVGRQHIATLAVPRDPGMGPPALAGTLPDGQGERRRARVVCGSPRETSAERPPGTATTART